MYAAVADQLSILKIIKEIDVRPPPFPLFLRFSWPDTLFFGVTEQPQDNPRGSGRLHARPPG